MTGIGKTTTNIQTLARSIGAAERQALEPHGLTVAGFAALEAISREPNITVTALAFHLHVSKQNTSVVLSRLADLKHISYGEAMTATSARRIRLTPAGRRALASASEAIEGVETRFTGAFGDRLAEFTRQLGIGLAALPGPREHTLRRTFGAQSASAATAGR